MSAWLLTVDVPPTVSIRRKRKGRVVTIETAAFPAIHNLRDWRLRSDLTKLHKRLLDELLLTSPGKRWAAEQLKARVKAGEHFDAMLVRRAPRPLDCDVRYGARGIGGDNLGSALKAGRDWTAKRLFGLKTDDDVRIRWAVGQERSALPRQYQLVLLVAPAAGREWWELPDWWLKGEL